MCIRDSQWVGGATGQQPIQLALVRTVDAGIGEQCQRAHAIRVARCEECGDMSTHGIAQHMCLLDAQSIENVRKALGLSADVIAARR